MGEGDIDGIIGGFGTGAPPAQSRYHIRHVRLTILGMCACAVPLWWYTCKEGKRKSSTRCQMYTAVHSVRKSTDRQRIVNGHSCGRSLGDLVWRGDGE